MDIYGSMLCKDCVQCRQDLDAAGVSYVYHDFAEDLSALKTFLALRDTDPAFSKAREQGYIGIPCIVLENGKILLDWSELIK